MEGNVTGKASLPLLLALPALALAQDPEPPRLHLSWSATAQQDTLAVTGSTWTHCYLWVHPSPLRSDFVGFWGTLFRTNAVEVHHWRYLASGADGDHVLDPAADAMPIAFLSGTCEDDTGPQVIVEFDVYVDAGRLGEPGSRASEVGLYPAGQSDWDPQIFYRVDPGEPCGYFSVGYAAETNRLSVRAENVAATRSTFGSLKAIYR